MSATRQYFILAFRHPVGHHFYHEDEKQESIRLPAVGYRHRNCCRLETLVSKGSRVSTTLTSSASVWPAAVKRGFFEILTIPDGERIGVAAGTASRTLEARSGIRSGWKTNTRGFWPAGDHRPAAVVVLYSLVLCARQSGFRERTVDE